MSSDNVLGYLLVQERYTEDLVAVSYNVSRPLASLEEAMKGVSNVPNVTNYVCEIVHTSRSFKPSLLPLLPREVYMVRVNCEGFVFVKALDFFRSQGGMKEEWGRDWVPILATSLENAREEACKKIPGARPYEQQGMVDRLMRSFP